MKIISWNVNGIRACIKKGFIESMENLDPDVICVQEIKAFDEQVPIQAAARWPHRYWHSAQKPGYSGTAMFCKEPPLRTMNGIERPDLEGEGRVLTAEFDEFWLVTVYTPNSQNELRRLAHRQEWDRAFLDYCKTLETSKPVVMCGDLNVAHQEIDIARPKANRKNPGFSDEEREGFDEIMESGFVDVFRDRHPGEPEHYTWWSYRANARARNIGWRLDYFCVSRGFNPRVHDCRIHPQVMGSDHCPIELTLD